MSTAEADDRPPATRSRVPRQLEVLAAWSWRLLVIAAAVIVVLLAMSRLRLVLVPVAVAFLLATLLTPPARWMVGRGFPPLLATWLVVLGFVAGTIGMGAAIVTPLVADLDDLDTTLAEAADDIETWLIDGPLGIERSRVEDGRERLGDAFDDAVSSDGRLVDGAVLVGEIIAGMLLAIVIAFFLVKDGPDLQERGLALLPSRHRERARRIGAAAWSTLGRYLVGAASLGLVESIIMGTTLALVGSDVVLPVAALTFIAAFFPFIGAIVAGLVATLVTLASTGPEGALVVAAVAVVVQQFDNDLLAPVIYGRVLKLHPLTVIVSVAAGAAVGGLIGAVAAVPFVAIAMNSYTADRDLRSAGTGEPADGDPPSGDD